jgi:hypothetical protein
MRRHRLGRTTPAMWTAGALALITATVVGGVWLTTHVVAPRILTHVEHFPALATAPRQTTNAKGLLGDPVNVAFVGTKAEIASALRAAGWMIADSISRASDLALIKSVLLDRPDSTAPVSPLYLFGRRQDIAFEQEVGRSARRRHHVRLWLDPGVGFHGRPVWLAAATFDLRAGLSHRGLHPTHHIAPDVDEERDTLTNALAHARQLTARFHVTGIGLRVDAHNAEGDRFDTDGELQVLVISPANALVSAAAELPDPPIVQAKDRLWRWGHHH